MWSFAPLDVSSHPIASPPTSFTQNNAGWFLLPSVHFSLDQNVISWNDFIEGVDNDSALSQMLRSVPGGGGPPLVRLVRGQGADGRWTEVS